MARRKQKLTPLERLVKRNTTQLTNLKNKRELILENQMHELGALDDKIAEVTELLKQLTKK